MCIFLCVYFCVSGFLFRNPYTGVKINDKVLTVGQFNRFQCPTALLAKLLRLFRVVHGQVKDALNPYLPQNLNMCGADSYPSYHPAYLDKAAH